MACIWAENSYCERRKVGALIVKDKMIISDGYNGTPAGFENVCEDDNNFSFHHREYRGGNIQIDKVECHRKECG